MSDDKRIIIKDDKGNSKYVEIVHSDGSRDVYKAVDLPLSTVASEQVAHLNPSGSGWDKRSDSDRHGKDKK